MSIDPQTLKEKHYSTSEAAKLLRVKHDTVRRYCNADPPRIKARKLFGKTGLWYIPQSEIDKYLAEESSTGRPKQAQRRNGRHKAGNGKKPA